MSKWLRLCCRKCGDRCQSMRETKECKCGGLMTRSSVKEDRQCAKAKRELKEMSGEV